MGVSANDSEWRTIPFAQGYQVNQYGEVKSCSRVIIRKDGKPYPIPEKILRQRKYRYATVDLKLGHQSLVHRLVAACFLGLDYHNSNQLVNHIDSDKLNNFVGNLEVCTPSYNVKDGFNKGRIIHNKGKSRFSSEDRLNIREAFSNGKTKRELAKMYDVSVTTIWSICNE